VNYSLEPAEDYLARHKLVLRESRKRSVALRVCFEFRGTAERLPIRLFGLRSTDSCQGRR
jgi:hypothetical protein